MKTMQIPKRNGTFRTVVCPSRGQKRRLRALIPELQRIVRSVCDLDCVQGAAELRSSVTNAMKHIGYRYSLCMDMSSFFDTVTSQRHGDKIKQRLGKDKFRTLWHQGVARQGLPTSPIVANIAASGFDSDILAYCKSANANGNRCVVTRYIDDVTVSFDNPSMADDLKRFISECASRHGFKINAKKTVLQTAKGGRRIITGIAVDDTGIHPTRDTKRKLRAAIFNAEHGRVKRFPRRQWSKYSKICKRRGLTRMPKQDWLRCWLRKKVRGLQEWMSLKLPGTGRRSATRIVDAMPAAEAMSELAARKMP